MPKQERVKRPIIYFVRPHVVTSALKTFWEACGLPHFPPIHHLIVRGLGKNRSSWFEIDLDQLRNLHQSSFMVEHDYLVCSRTPGLRQATLKRKEFLDLLFAKPQPVFREKRAHPGGGPKYDYFVQSQGSFRDTIIDLLKGYGESCEDQDLVELKLGLGRTVKAWLIQRETMKILYTDNRLNPWRQNLFYRRLEGDRSGRAMLVPDEYFRKMKLNDLYRHVRKAASQ